MSATATHEFHGFTRHQGYFVAHVYCPVRDKDVEVIFTDWDAPQTCDFWTGCDWIEGD